MMIIKRRNLYRLDLVKLQRYRGGFSDWRVIVSGCTPEFFGAKLLAVPPDNQKIWEVRIAHHKVTIHCNGELVFSCDTYFSYTDGFLFLPEDTATERFRIDSTGIGTTFTYFCFSVKLIIIVCVRLAFSALRA